MRNEKGHIIRWARTQFSSHTVRLSNCMFVAINNGSQPPATIVNGFVYQMGSAVIQNGHNPSKSPIFVEREKGYFPLNLAFGFGACSLLLSLVSSSSLVIKKARVASAVKWIVWCDQVYKDIISVCVINFIAWFTFLVLISANNFSINIIERQCQPYQCGIIELILYRYFKT